MLAKRVQRLDKTHGTFGIIPWMDIITLIFSLPSFNKPKPNPVPNPEPNPTPLQKEAWDKAGYLKSTAESSNDGNGNYDGPGFKKTAAGIRKQKRKDGEKIGKDEANRLATIAFADAEKSTLEDLYHDVLEKTHAA